MPDKTRGQPSEIIVKVPVGLSGNCQRIAAEIVALLHRAGIAAEVVVPDKDDPPDDAPSDDRPGS